MSLQKLFNKPSKIVTNTTLDKLADDVESADYVDQYLTERNRFLPAVDFTLPKNFAFYGSAEQYYRDSIQRVARTYPYDGSDKEKINWHISSSYLDLSLLRDEYPRATGYAHMAAAGWGTQTSASQGYGAPATVEYIKIKGGPNLGPSGTYVGSNIFDSSKTRGSNLQFAPLSGNTVEFWLKKDAFDINKTEKEIIFDLDNNQTTAANITGRLRITLTGSSVSPFLVTYGYYSGSFSIFKGLLSASIGQAVTTGSLTAWQHYAFVFHGTGSATTARLYINGDLNHTITTSSMASLEVTGGLEANIGGLLSSHAVEITGAVVTEGWAKLSGTLDEFRFWKVARSDRDIGRYWFTQVGGGTNTDVANTDLGVYYKFNEGITLTSSVDAIVLDYSGRLSNGAWSGYSSVSRNTGSAIVSASAADAEFLDPIVYEFHPDVQGLISQKVATGSAYDVENNSMMLRMFPDQMVDDDLARGTKVLSNLTQIVASYFDTAFLQIKALPEIKNLSYASGSGRPSVFSRQKVESLGLITPDLFVDAEVWEELSSRNENKNYEVPISEIKNTIYQSIYNNLSFIFKAKGTEKAFRNLIRCFGVDEEVVRLNIYSQNQRFTLQDNLREVAYKERYADFNKPNHFDALVYQYVDPDNGNTVGFVSGNAWQDIMPWTAECGISFPKNPEINTDYYFNIPFTGSSLFGMHSVKFPHIPSDTTWLDTDEPTFTVQAHRDYSESTDAYFKLNLGSVTLTSSLYSDVYDNTNWALAVKVYNLGYPFGEAVVGISSSANVVEFQGIQTSGGKIINQFNITSSMSAVEAKTFLTEPRRFFVGADRDNFTGSVISRTDVRTAYMRYWLDYIEPETVELHAKDIRNFGHQNPSTFAHVFDNEIPNVEIGRFDNLLLNWDFRINTGSDASGRFVVNDFSSGSAAQTRYGWLDNIYNRQHSGRGDFFVASSTSSINIDYVLGVQQQHPEIVQSVDMVNILTQDDEFFTRNTRPQTYSFAFEKNMYYTISQEMLNYFGTIVEFNNLIGAPAHKYRHEYKDLIRLRNLFYDNVRNTPDIEKYIEYYKWLDSSLIQMLKQMIPASAEFSDALSTVIESHVLERNKIKHQYPTMEFSDKIPVQSTNGIGQLLYNWKYGSRPIGGLERNNSLYWRLRAERE